MKKEKTEKTKTKISNNERVFSNLPMKLLDQQKLNISIAKIDNHH